jgi:hypothetical protein
MANVLWKTNNAKQINLYDKQISKNLKEQCFCSKANFNPAMP